MQSKKSNSNYYKEQFKNASETGRSILILKSSSDCDCYNKNSLIDSEPNPKCPKCYGTGKKRILIKTPKLRYELSSSGKTGYLESQDLIKTTNEIYSFYLDEYLGFVNNEDIFITFDEDGKPIAAFEVSNREKFVYYDFVYYEYFAKKLTYLPEVNEIEKKIR